MIPGSPADQTKKIHPRDIIISIDGTSCRSLSQEKIDRLLQEKRSTPLSLHIRRNSSTYQQFTISLLPQTFIIKTDRVTFSCKETNYGTLLFASIPSFYRHSSGISTTQDFLKEWNTYPPPQGLLLDIRNNQGGYISEAMTLIGLFIRTGALSKIIYRDGTEYIFRDLDPQKIYSGPIIILTSSITASAAEILAQTLKDYGRAIIVGDPHTYGKAALQMQTLTQDTPIPYTMTVGHMFSVAGYGFQGQGVRADIIVPSLWLSTPSQTKAHSNNTSPLFKDTLPDINPKQHDWYQEYYLPFLEKKDFHYRQWIPQLSKQSAIRMQRNPLWNSLRITHDESKDTLAYQIQQQEAKKILEDLVILLNPRKDAENN